jgi:SWI/SNF-related matrix-associated actin-dependent regulator 1 of chromatin subfamily A
VILVEVSASSANNNSRYILEHILETLHLSFIQLDSWINIEDRQSILDAFHERTDIAVFLLLMTAGGAGINLAWV